MVCSHWRDRRASRGGSRRSDGCATWDSRARAKNCISHGRARGTAPGAPGCRTHRASSRPLRRARARVGERMSVTHDEVRRIARLAELDVSDDALPLLAEQMSRILEYVAQINAVPASEAVKPFVPGPDAVRFRPDEVKPWPLAFGPAELAPAFRDGFFLVPKLGQFEDAGA